MVAELNSSMCEAPERARFYPVSNACSRAWRAAPAVWSGVQPSIK